MSRAGVINQGDKYGLWTVASEAFSIGHGLAVLCRCCCGNLRRVVCSELRRGKSTNCGCQPRHQTHGHTVRRRQSLTYSSWCAMRTRCTDPFHKWYPNYGGAGVTVCEKWLDSFDAFLADMGERPSSAHSLDRIDNSKGYDPSNCKWSTRPEQRRNSRRTINVTIDGKTQCLTDWCRETGIKFGTAYDRIKKGWDPAKAVLSPVSR